MYRNEAVTYLKELMAICEQLSPELVFFENPKDSSSLGYRVHIKGTIHDNDRQAVREVAKKHSLEVLEDSSGFVIYKSLK